MSLTAGTDADLPPHVARALRRVLGADGPNLLLTDDASLGKGLVLGSLVSALRRNGPQRVLLLKPATFMNEAGLEAQGGNLFLETAASGQATVASAGDPGLGTLMQGFVEASNVNPVAEITALITAQRAYEMNSRVVKTADEMLATSSQLR